MVIKDKTIAIVEDEQHTAKLFSEYLTTKGYSVYVFLRAESFMDFLKEKTPDIILLDLMLPDIHGFDLCHRIRSDETSAGIPIIIISANNTEHDKVMGLDIGADDYMVKPVSLRELASRINAVLRRNYEEEHVLNVGSNVVIDLDRYQVKVNDNNVDLTTTEFRILSCLASKKGHVFSRERILSYLWGNEKRVVSRAVDVHIRHIREKMGDTADYIRNVRGVGYKIVE